MLEIRNIYKSFGNKTVACDVSLTVDKGKILAILGASGSGKSSLLNMVAGLLRPDSGDVVIDGVIQNKIVAENRGVAMMFQDFALLPHLNVLDNAAFSLRLRGMRKTLARSKAQVVLNEVGLGGELKRRIDDLSGGEKQRVALARALAIEPKVLLLDEPFSALDTELRGQMQQQMQRLVSERLVPTVLVTHDASEAALLADNIALLDDGRLLQYGQPETLFAQPVSARAARLLGCVNISEKAYIPPEAVSCNESGLMCQCVSSHRCAQGWRVVFKHPQWGEIETLYREEVLPESGCLMISVNKSKVVLFEDVVK